jgi:hypothetical protein
VIISVPVWGDWHRWIFQTVSWPSYREQMRGDRLLIHGAPFAGIEAEYRPLPEGPNEYARAAAAHRDVIRLAAGEPIVFVPPDNILSANALDAVRARLDDGARLVAACSIRVSERAPRPVPSAPRDLIKWALHHPHEITRRSIWGSRVSTTCPSINLFRTQWGAVARCFHLHPLAMNAATDRFAGTIDDDLVSKFAPEQVHVVTDSDELAIVEISPVTKALGEQKRPLTLADLDAFRARKANAMHQFFFEHRICLKAKEFHDVP